MAHGITDNGLCWTLVAQELANEYDVIMVDARGHGHSEAPVHGYAPMEHARDLVGLIRTLDLEKPALVGHSMGAFTAATLAANYPGTLSCMVLEDPPWQKVDSAATGERVARRAQWRETILQRKKLSHEELVAAGKEQSPLWTDAEFEAWSEAKHQVNPNVVEYIDDSFERWADLVPRIDCPTLLVTGAPELGGIVTPEVAAQVAEMNKQITVVHIPGAGHNVRRDQLDAYVAVVKRFLAEWVVE
jgi:N-formylmaleamate deformylase